jgi:3-hydroxyacyl-[acyl-carrier-protein] dehydratase
LLDKVTELVPRERICAEKALSLAEEYLGDHFPTFPVLPGVLMLEAMVQTAAMLVRVSEGFRHSMIMLEEARNIKYKSFVKPGGILRLEVKARSIGEGQSSFVGQGFVEDRPTVEGRFTLRHYNLADENPAWAHRDARLVADMKQRAQLVGAWHE